MSAKQVVFRGDARSRMVGGVNLLANAVRVTLGPKGRNVLIDSAFGAPKVTKDGVSVAKEIELKDKFENMGAQLVKEVASKTGDAAGDGTTTATVLAQAIANEGLKSVAAGADPMDIKRGIEKAAAAAIEALRQLAVPCDDAKAIAQVGTISANGDEAIGKLIADAMSKVGKDGVITVEEGKGLDNELQVVEGMQFDRGYISPYFINNVQRQTVEFDNPLLLLTDKRTSNLRDLVPLLEAVSRQGRPLVIVAEDIEGEALAALVVNSMRGVLKVVAVKAPSFGDRRKEIMRDIAALTGATLISDDVGLSLERTGLEHLGSAKRMLIEKENTTIVDGAGERAAIDARIQDIRTQIANTSSDYEQEKLHERLAKLVGGVAVIKVGAATEIEMKEKKDRVDDAVHATHAAVEEGIVAGGGVALVRAALAVAEVKGANPDQQAGVDILRRALQAPLRQIARNAGAEPSVVLNRVAAGEGTFGYNAASAEYGDMIAFGVIDPAKVTRLALQNSISVAGLLLTTEAMVGELPKAEPAAAPGGGEMDED